MDTFRNNSTFAYCSSYGSYTLACNTRLPISTLSFTSFANRPFICLSRSLTLATHYSVATRLSLRSITRFANFISWELDLLCRSFDWIHKINFEVNMDITRLQFPIRFLRIAFEIKEIFKLFEYVFKWPHICCRFRASERKSERIESSEATSCCLMILLVVGGHSSWIVDFSFCLIW